MKIIVDTSCIIDFLRRKDKESTVWYDLVYQGYEILLPIVVHTELMSGKRIWQVTQAYEETKRLLQSVTVVPLTLEISERAGFIRATYDLDIMDSLIATTALKHNLPLATLNTKHFEKVANLELYSGHNNKPL